MLSFASPPHNHVALGGSSPVVRGVDFRQESLPSMNGIADTTQFFGDHRVSTLDN